MENAIPHHLFRFFRHVNVASEKRVVKANLALFTVRHFSAVFAQQMDPNILEYRFPDGRDVIAPVYDKLSYMESCFAHSIVVDQLNSVKIYPISSLTPGHQSFEAGGDPVRHDAENRRRQKSQIHSIFCKLSIHLHRILSSFFAENNHPHSGIDRIHVYFDSSDKPQRCHHGHAGLFVDQIPGMRLQGSLIQLDLAVFLQDAFRLSGTPGCVNGKARIMRIRLPVPCLRLRRQNIVPSTLINHKTALAVLANCINSFRRIVVLHHSEGGACFPDSQHGDKRARVARKSDHDKIFRTDSMSRQPCVDTGRQIVHLRPRKTYPRGLPIPGERYPKGLLLMRYPRGLLLMRYPRGLLLMRYPRGLLLLGVRYLMRYPRGLLLHLDKRCGGIFFHHFRPTFADIRYDIEKSLFHILGLPDKIFIFLFINPRSFALPVSLACTYFRSEAEGNPYALSELLTARMIASLTASAASAPTTFGVSFTSSYLQAHPSLPDPM